MYQNPSQTAQWSPNQPPPTSQPTGQWSPQPPNGQYAPRQNQIPPISQAVPQGGPAMPTLQPQHPDHYRALPAPPQMYGPPYQQPPQMPYPPAQPAPRQRTAIACRYCRRRKIRCSGFDQSEDGRCTNCQRFSQECVFTPVSAQTQAFVPAHTVWRGQNPPPNTQLYGAYGQPLPQHGNRDPYPPQQQPGQYPPPPQGYQQQPTYQPQANQAPMQPAQAGQKRANDEPHTPTLAPPGPGAQGQRGSAVDGQAYMYPDPSGMNPAGASPASSTASFHSAQPPPQPYYTQAHPPAHRASPQSAYSFDASRASSSPHPSHLQPGAIPIRDGRTPPPNTAANMQRVGVKINDIVGPGGHAQQQAVVAQAQMTQEERTSTDTTEAPGNTADGTAATTEGAADKQEEALKRKSNGEVRDAGVQVNLIGPAAVEQDS